MSQDSRYPLREGGWAVAPILTTAKVRGLLYLLFLLAYQIPIQKYVGVEFGNDIWRNSFPLYEDLKIPGKLFTSQNTPHITHGNEQCLKLLLGVCNTKKRGDLSLSLFVKGDINVWPPLKVINKNVNAGGVGRAPWLLDLSKISLRSLWTTIWM